MGIERTRTRWKLSGAASLGKLILVSWTGFLAGCETGKLLVLGQSPIAPGIYVGERECNSIFNGSESTESDTIRFTIDNDGLLVLNGETMHLGLVNTFATGAITQSSVIRAITITDDGFTIDWDTTTTVNGIVLSGYFLESWKAVDPDSFEFFSTHVVSSPGNLFMSECSSTMSR